MARVAWAYGISTSSPWAKGRLVTAVEMHGGSVVDRKCRDNQPRPRESTRHRESSRRRSSHAKYTRRGFQAGVCLWGACQTPISSSTADSEVEVVLSHKPELVGGAGVVFQGREPFSPFARPRRFRRPAESVMRLGDVTDLNVLCSAGGRNVSHSLMRRGLAWCVSNVRRDVLVEVRYASRSAGYLSRASGIVATTKRRGPCGPSFGAGMSACIGDGAFLFVPKRFPKRLAASASARASRRAGPHAEGRISFHVSPWSSENASVKQPRYVRSSIHSRPSLRWTIVASIPPP